MPSVLPFTCSNSLTVWEKNDLLLILFNSTFVQKKQSFRTSVELPFLPAVRGIQNSHRNCDFLRQYAMEVLICSLL